MDRENFGQFIAEARRNAGFTQKYLASRLHVTNSAVSKWERGLCYPDVTLMGDLAQALGLNVTELLSCGVSTEEKSLLPQAEENVSSLLDIAKESKRRQRKRIFGGLATVFAVALAVVLLISFTFSYFIIPNKDRVATVEYFGCLTKDAQNFIYMEWRGQLLCLRCEDPALFDDITSHPYQKCYDITYRLDRWNDQEVLVSAERNEEFLGSPMDMQGSSIVIDRLLGKRSVSKEISAVYPAPNGDGYLYNYRFSYPNGEENIAFLNITNCRAAITCDYDNDGTVELIVKTRYDNAPYMVYDIEGKRIFSVLVDQAPDEVLQWLQAEY